MAITTATYYCNILVLLNHSNPNVTHCIPFNILYLNTVTTNNKLFSFINNNKSIIKEFRTTQAKNTPVVTNKHKLFVYNYHLLYLTPAYPKFTEGAGDKSL